MDNKEFAHLHLHTEFSVLDGYGKAEMWAKRAAELGFEYLGLTNHGTFILTFPKIWSIVYGDCK